MAEIPAEELLRRYEAGERDFRGLDLSEIELSGSFVETDFTGANFQFSQLWHCVFESCNLSEIDLRSAYVYALQINQCIMTGANLSNLVRSIIIRDTDLRMTQIKRVHLYSGRFIDCDLRSVDLSESLFKHIKFTGSSLEGAKLTWSDFSGSDFEGVDLSRADLKGTNFSRCNLKGADLSGANLRSAVLSSANLTSACLDNANLWGAWLDDAVLCDASLLYAKGNHAILKGANFKDAKTSPDFRLYRHYFLRGALLWDTILPDGDLVVGPEWTRE